jgi:Zn ribbon nucleic-acid-binding protein
MSQKSKYPIVCPKCGNQEKVDLYDAINLADDPKLKKALLANKINAVECGKCGFSYRIDKNLLYHDPEKMLMIYLLDCPWDEYEAAQTEFLETVKTLSQALPDDVTPPQVHLVINRSELIERIFLHEAGLNERIIEYIKFQIYTRNSETADPEQKILLFNAQDSTADDLCFILKDAESGKLEGMLNYKREAYDAYTEMFEKDDEVGNIFELFPGPYISARTTLLADDKDADQQQQPS